MQGKISRGQAADCSRDTAARRRRAVGRCPEPGVGCWKGLTEFSGYVPEQTTPPREDEVTKKPHRMSKNKAQRSNKTLKK